MNPDKQQTYDYAFWKAKLPSYPKANGISGAKVGLTPKIAANILTEIAHGANPREAFDQENISSRTFTRYLKRAQDENEIGHYLREYFAIQLMAQEVANDRISRARLEFLNPAPKRHVHQTRVTKTRKAVVNGKVVRLRDVVTTQTTEYTEPCPLEKII
jgi:hypothetical protein